MMTNLDDIRAHWAEYNTGAHQVDWYIDRGLGLAQDVGVLLEMLERQQERIAKLEYQYESKVPGTQGAMLDAFYALLPPETETSSEPAPGILRRTLKRQQAVIDAAKVWRDHGGGDEMDAQLFDALAALDAQP